MAYHKEMSCHLHYLIYTPESDTKGKSLANYNPFLFAKTTEMAIGGKPLQTTMLRDGKLLMRMRNHKEAKKLYNINLNHGDNCMKVKVYEHKF